MNNIEWNTEITKGRNKPKGCIHSCGMRNNKGMVRCDGCGGWAHFKCQREKRRIPEIIPEEDFYTDMRKEKRREGEKENYEERGGGNKDGITGIECEFISQNDKNDKEDKEKEGEEKKEDNGKDEDHDKRNMENKSGKENKNKETEEEIKEVTNPHKENTKEDKKDIYVGR